MVSASLVPGMARRRRWNLFGQTAQFGAVGTKDADRQIAARAGQHFEMRISIGWVKLVSTPGRLDTALRIWLTSHSLSPTRHSLRA
jgi:hypothetical protein